MDRSLFLSFTVDDAVDVDLPPVLLYVCWSVPRVRIDPLCLPVTVGKRVWGGSIYALLWLLLAMAPVVPGEMMMRPLLLL